MAISTNKSKKMPLDCINCMDNLLWVGLWCSNSKTDTVSIACFGV